MPAWKQQSMTIHCIEALITGLGREGLGARVVDGNLSREWLLHHVIHEQQSKDIMLHYCQGMICLSSEFVLLKLSTVPA